MARILCVEDDSDIQHMIGQALFRDGYDVHYAWNGQEGYEKILSLNPDLILLDLVLPLLNGVELLEKLRLHKAAQDIPIIVLTSFGDEADMLSYSVKALGAVSYLRKPIDMPEFASLVRHTLLQFPPKSGRRSDPAAREFRKGAVRADVRFSTVWINDRLVATLPQKEFSLLCCLMESDGPVAREDLLRQLEYKPSAGDALKQIVHRLRESLGPNEQRRVKTVDDGYELIG